MERAPADPVEFFGPYLRERFEGAREHVVGWTSVGSVTFRVIDAGEWSLRLNAGELEVTRGLEDDVMLQVTIPLADFDPLVASSVNRAGGISETGAQTAGPPKPLRAGVLRALAADPETARLVRHIPGSVLFVARNADVRHRLLVTPGRRPADLESPACTIECTLEDMIAAQTGGVPPMQLFVQGKLKISGNVQVAMALSSLFA